jgi:excisionase family DNA binding protein
MEQASETASKRPLAYSIPEVADELRCSISHVYELIARGHLRRVKIGTRTLVRADELDRLLAEGTE